jgi:alcohol-forming fatty acyl-CoA reductase
MSTAYSNCYLKYIEEKFYKSPLDYKAALKLLTFDEDFIYAITDKLVNPWPNTYTFTKSITEDMIRQYKDLPIVISRPSVVAPAYKDYPGYSKLFSPLCEIAAGMSVGLIRIIYGSPEVISNNIPIDSVINGSLAAAALQKNVQHKYPIYNIVDKNNLKEGVKFLFQKNHKLSQKTIQPNFY